ncbi:MAG: hypothetical protein Pg6A_15270 [Termitinemataceae bacterium]|nr:MAG: hypothetical protein Pg6A_15270 [Termitinemataceae bacterium]
MKEPPFTWDDVITNFQKAIDGGKNADGAYDPEKFMEFKKQILGHLDNLEKKEKKSEKAKKTGIKKQPEKITFASETYLIDEYILWDDEVYAAAQEFYKHKTIYPNILLANSKTFSLIDENVKKYGTTNLVYEGKETEPPEFGGLSAFTAGDFSLDFCLDETAADDHFCLIYDNDPSFDGEEVDEPGALFAHKGARRGKYSRYKLAA